MAPFRIEIATRNCFHCGKRAIAEPEGGENQPPFSREQLDAACEASARSHNRVAWLMFVGFLMFLASPIAIALYRDTIRDSVRLYVEPGWFVSFAMLFPGFVVCIIALLLLARIKRDALKCPHCNSPCSMCIQRGAHNLTQVTGNCANCGQRLVNGILPEEEVGQLPTAEEFQAARREAMRPNWFGFSLIVVILATLIALVAIVNPERRLNEALTTHGPVTGTIIVSVTLSVCILGFFGVGLLGLYWLKRQYLRKWDAVPILNCPHCRGRLFEASQIIASRRCPSCSKRVLANPE